MPFGGDDGDGEDPPSRRMRMTQTTNNAMTIVCLVLPAARLRTSIQRRYTIFQSLRASDPFIFDRRLITELVAAGAIDCGCDCGCGIGIEKDDGGDGGGGGGWWFFGSLVVVMTWPGRRMLMDVYRCRRRLN